MRPLGSRLLVAFDAGSVSAGLASWGLGGLRIRRAAQVPLASGALVPSPFESNFGRLEEVREALRQLRERVGSNGRRALLILPDGLARIVLLDLPPKAAATEYARFRLAQASPYPLNEAIVSMLEVGRRRVLAAAVHRRVVEGYETVAAAAGFSQERLTLSPLAGLLGLRRSLRGSGRTVGVILGDTALSLAMFEGETLRAFRNRRRDPGPDEAFRVGQDVLRTTSLEGVSVRPRLRVVGPGAGALTSELTAAGWAVDAAWRAVRGDGALAVEWAWLGAAAG